MVKKEDNRKLRGSVLLTVVCVMSLLIVFLFGTLTLATASNNRAHVNYSSAQTDVTSRIVVDSAIRAISVNNDYGSFIGSIGESDTGKTVNVTLGDGVPNRGRYGDIAPVSVEWAGTKDFYDPINQKWANGGVLKFTSTVSMAGVDSTTSAYVVKQPAGTSSTGKGAGFVTVAGANLTCQTDLFGGSYINIPTETMIKDLDYTYRNRQYHEDHWDKSDPYTHDETYYRQFAPYVNEATSFLLDNSGAYAESDLFVNNNMYIDDWSGFIFPDNGTGISVWGDLVFGNASVSYTSKVKSSTDLTDSIAFNEIPYIYVDGKIGGVNHVNIGDKTNPFPLNIFCGSIDASNNWDNTGKLNEAWIAGDLYCMNPAETSYLGGQNPSELYSWTRSVITQSNPGGKFQQASSVYSKGNLVLKNITIKGDLRVEGDLIIPDIGSNNTVKVEGDVVVGGKLIIKGNQAELSVTTPGKHIYCQKDKVEIPGATFAKDETNYKEVPTIAVLNNGEKRNYFVYNLDNYKDETDPYNPKYDGLLGEKFEKWQVEDNGLHTIYYTWKEDFNPANSDYYTEDAWKDGEGNLKTAELLGYIDTSVAYIDSKNSPASPSGDTDSYIVEPGTSKKMADADVAVTKYFPTIDGANSGFSMEEIINSKIATEGSDYGYSPSSSYVVYDTTTGKIVPAGSNLTLTDVPDKYKNVLENLGSYSEDIYPTYATREVILNLKNDGGKLVPDDTPHPDTQIIKTFDQILASAANPFKTLPDALAQFIQDYKDPTKTVTVYTAITDLEQDAEGNYIIDSDCVLDFSVPSDKAYNIMIKPKAESNNVTFNIIIKKFELQGSGSKLILDDVSGNNAANIYVSEQDNDSSPNFVMLTGSKLTTKKYEDFFSSCDTKIGYDSSSVADKNDLGVSAGRPNINIYGGQNSYMKISNGSPSYIAANITSEHLKFEIASSAPNLTKTDGTQISSIIYNDFELVNPKACIFGCLNAKEVVIPNDFKVIYVTDKVSDPPDPSTAEFDYRVLYYDEY
ncbi:MAG: hypothetical protein K2K91_05370 [Ruminococcus sp.]|nr:hypothetical protein [Ruminococcus sp.]